MVMGMTLIEKILAAHSREAMVKPDQIIDVIIDTRAARDFGGANVVKNLKDHGMGIDDPAKTFFTFDCNPTGSDQSYAVNQHICRTFARDHGIKVYDIDRGIGTHLMIDQGLVWPGCTAVTTDSHANILGAIGAFGQGMGDMDIAAAWSKGKIWFKVPPSLRIVLKGKRPAGLSAKDITLNLLRHFGANGLLGYSAEIYGEIVDSLSLDERITISSMGTEMGAIIILFSPNREILDYCHKKTGRRLEKVTADENAVYEKTVELNLDEFVVRASRPGKPHDTVPLQEVKKIKIDSGFIGSCTNGRMEDMKVAANILRGKKVAPGVVLKIVPSTNEVWQQCLEEGIIQVFKDAGALVSNAGCAGCAAGQVGQNGPGEVTISTGNRNFPGKQGKGDVYLASPAVVAASAVAGYITVPGEIPAEPALFTARKTVADTGTAKKKEIKEKPDILEGRVWIIKEDNIDTDMIFHNRHLAVTDFKEMGQYAFGNLKGYEDFAKKAQRGDMIVTGKNFGAGSSRQQAVDCFLSLGVAAIIAESFGAIYERNAINAALPILIGKELGALELQDGDHIRLELKTGKVTNLRNGKTGSTEPFSDVQMDIYRQGGLF
jgi:3-isopropylmalate/(R)-2-methylmalate dehydratase large subunit